MALNSVVLLVISQIQVLGESQVFLVRSVIKCMLGPMKGEWHEGRVKEEGFQ